MRNYLRGSSLVGLALAKLLIHDSISRLTKKYILLWQKHVQLAEKAPLL